MAVAVSSATPIEANSGLYKAIQQPNVTGGKETDPLWECNVSNENFAEALRLSLAATTMLDAENGRFKLNAELLKLKKPFARFDCTVTSTVKYTLTDAANNVVWSDTIVAPYAAELADAFMGVKRMQLAEEGSIKQNISKVIEALISESKTDPALAPVKPVAMRWITFPLG